MTAPSPMMEGASRPTPDSPMVERVAGAILAKVPLGYGMTDREAREYARAAIEALREPTEPMIEASNREWDGRMSHRSSGAWQAMIDAALGEAV